MSKAEESPKGITESEDIALHVEYMKIIPTKMPKVKVERFKQEQREVKIEQRK